MRQGAAASVISTDIDFASGTCSARAAAPGDAKDEVNRIDLLARPNADGPGESTVAQTLPEPRGEAITGIGQHAAEAQTDSACPVDLSERISGLVR